MVKVSGKKLMVENFRANVFKQWAIKGPAPPPPPNWEFPVTLCIICNLHVNTKIFTRFIIISIYIRL